MPMPSDSTLVQLAEDLLAAFDKIFGLHPGYRPAHAKGVMLRGRFTPAPEAAALSRAPHFNRAQTPVTVRFSNSTGLPMIADSDPNASPRGMAVRFHLGDRQHTDIVSHSTDGFPTRTGQEFLEFLRALASGDPSTFLASHPAALAFAQVPKPNPSSFARELYFGVTAFRFLNQAGAVRHGRYRLAPGAGLEHVEAETAAGWSDGHLFDELAGRISREPIRFELQVQLAEDGDVVDDATVPWPAQREVRALGNLVLEELAPDDAENRRIIFDPIPRVDGLEPSADPLLELRAAIYLLSGRRRRASEVTRV